jgi:hypothetical protein
MSICLTTGHEVSAPPVTKKRRCRFWHSATAGMRVAVLKPEIPAHTPPQSTNRATTKSVNNFS